jgi:hypothetical protein
MRRSYKYLYHAAPIPIVRSRVDYDPVGTYLERCAAASRLAKRRKKLHAVKALERRMDLIVPSVLAVVMLPVLWLVGVIMLARALWRRYAHGRARQRTVDNQSRSHARPPFRSSRIERNRRGGQHRARRIRGRRSSRGRSVPSPRHRMRSLFTGVR